jgi:phenylpyruvate tautomerase
LHVAHSQYVLVTLKTDVPVMFAGTEEPAAYGDLHSIGAIGGEKNKEASMHPAAQQ